MLLRSYYDPITIPLRLDYLHHSKTSPRALYLPDASFLPRMPPTLTTDRILIESRVLTHSPAGSRQSLWGIFNHRYLLLSVSLVSESLAIDFPAQNAPLPTPQTEFSSSFVSSSSVRPAPDTPYGTSFIIGISCDRYLLYRNLLLSIFPPRMPP